MRSRKSTGELWPGSSQYLYCVPYWEHVGYNIFIFRAVVSAGAFVDPTVPSGRERIEKRIYSVLTRHKHLQFEPEIWQILCCKGQQPLIFVYKKTSYIDDWQKLWKDYFSANHQEIMVSALLQAHIVSASELIQRLSSVIVVSGTNTPQQNKSSISSSFLVNWHTHGCLLLASEITVAG